MNARQSGETIAVAYVVRSFQTCDTSAGKLDFRALGRSRLGLPAGKIKRGGGARGKKCPEVSPEVDAGWVAHLLKVL